MHASFLLGLALVGPFALEALIEARPEDRLKTLRGWALFGGSSTLICLCNPQGLRAFVYPVFVMNMKMLSAIVEWRPASF